MELPLGRKFRNVVAQLMDQLLTAVWCLPFCRLDDSERTQLVAACANRLQSRGLESEIPVVLTRRASGIPHSLYLCSAPGLCDPRRAEDTSNRGGLRSKGRRRRFCGPNLPASPGTLWLQENRGIHTPLGTEAR